ncbi:MAG: Jag N-terminal domain-containing protein [Candidatus Omnitrophota bacterium]
MENIEIEGKTVEEAIRKALKQLGVPRKFLKIQVLSEGEKGLFGMNGAKLAKIRVTVLGQKKEK